MNIQTIANYLTGFCESYFLFILFESFMKWKDEIPKYIKLIGILSVGVLINISNSLFATGMANIVLVILIEYIASYLYVGSQKARILLSALSFMIAIVTEVIVLLILSAAFNKNVNDIINTDIFRIIGIILSKTIGYVCVKLISFKLKKEISISEINYCMLFTVMFGITILTMYTFCKMLEEGASNHIRNMTILCSFGLGLATMIILFLYERTLRQKYMINQNQLYETWMKEQMKHYDDIMMTQGQVKKIKHDLENHLLSIKAQINRCEYNECVEYVNNLLNDIELGNSYIDTGNTVLDAIINAKKVEAEKNNIEFNLDLRIPEGIPLAKEDECIIFGNALDNAIEACKKVNSLRYIDISIVFDKDSLICKIVNSCNSKNINSVITTKDDARNHGIGKNNIKNALGKYNSISRVTHTETEYILFFIIMGIKY